MNVNILINEVILDGVEFSGKQAEQLNTHLRQHVQQLIKAHPDQPLTFAHSGKQLHTLSQACRNDAPALLAGQIAGDIGACMGLGERSSNSGSDFA